VEVRGLLKLKMASALEAFDGAESAARGTFDD
jgi:hypothetical protein